MPKKKDVPCSGGCGALIWRGPGCLPPGQSMCRPCRRQKPLLPSQRQWRSTMRLTCEACGSEFDYTPTGGTRRRSCSRKCSDRLRAATKAEFGCAMCGSSFERETPSAYCHDCQHARQLERWRRKNVKRRGATVIGPVMTLNELGERDQWRCHLCHKKVDKSLRSPDQMSATKDHLLPIAAGGDDDPANLALAHRACNVRRGTGGTVQLLLVG